MPGVLLALTAGPALAQSDKVAVGPPPGWVPAPAPLAVPADASGLAFVRYNDSYVRLDEKGQTNHVAFRIKLLHPNALQLGNLQVSWNPAAGAPVVHAIRVYRDGAVTDVLSKAKFAILRREDQLEAARLEGTLTAAMQVPDLRVGDELEFAVTLPGSDPTLKNRSAGLIPLAKESAPGRYRMGLLWTAGQEPQVRITPDLAATAVRRSDGVTLQLDNPAPLAPPKDAPARYNWQRLVEYSDFKDWPSLSRQFAPLYRAAAVLPANSPVKAEARKIAAAHATALERAAAALKLVQQEVRYIYVGMDGGNLSPASAEETWARRYGDCKGKTSLLLALLAELNIAAEPVLASNALGGDGFDAWLPSPALFDHVLVRAQIDGAAYWLDGTLPPVAVPARAPALPYRALLPVSETGSGLVTLPWVAPTVPDDITLFDIDASKGFDAPARITSTTIVRGMKALEQYVQYSSVTPAQLLTAFQQNAVGQTWQSIDKVGWRYDPKTKASILVVGGLGNPGWEDDGDGERSLTLPGGGFYPPERRVRPSGKDSGVPFAIETDFTCRVTSVRLPKASTAGQWSWSAPINQSMFGRSYFRAFELRDGVMRMVRGSRADRAEVDTASALRDNARVASFDNGMAMLSFDPRGTNGAQKVATLVPSATEIDWTGNQVPCTAETAKVRG